MQLKRVFNLAEQATRPREKISIFLTIKEKAISFLASSREVGQIVTSIKIGKM